MSSRNILITGSRKGIGRYLAEKFLAMGDHIIGCSRSESDLSHKNYKHFCLDVCDEKEVLKLFNEVRKNYKHLDVLINNAGIASMNHSILTPMKTAERVIQTNFLGTFLFCREAAKVLKKKAHSRIVNFGTVATPLRLEGEAVYAASKAAVVTLTEILAKEFTSYGITVNVVAPTPVDTDLIRNVPEKKLDELLKKQAIKRFASFKDVENVIEFYLKPESDFVTGQVLFLGGVTG
jgi:3-oxoacyl-[acyl-carrier protein] reductase